MYYNPITQRYHFNERNVEDLLDSLLYTDQQINELLESDTTSSFFTTLVDKYKDVIDFDFLSKALSIKDINGYYSLSNNEYNLLKSRTDGIVLIYKNLFSDGSIKTLENYNSNESKHYFLIVSDIFHYLNSLGVGISPSKIYSFVDDKNIIKESEHEKLFQFIHGGKVAVAFVDYKFRENEETSLENPIMRDVCKLEKKNDGNIVVGVRGKSYGDLSVEESKDIDVFISLCKELNLKWINKNC